VPSADPVHKVTIIPRGRALGLTQSLPTEDRLSLSREQANDHIAVMMGGRIAEELIFNQLTTGAANDLQQATDLARKMVCDWGMSEKLGPMHFGRREEMIFLGRDFNEQKDYSEQTAIEIDAEVKKIVTSNYERAKGVVAANLDKLKVLAEALLEYETLDGAEIDVLFSGKRMDRPPAIPREDKRPAADPKSPPAAAVRPPLFPRPLPDPEKA
jgi:cell division protease FtsH